MFRVESKFYWFINIWFDFNTDVDQNAFFLWNIKKELKDKGTRKWV